jgi:hypothetical protein
MIALDLLTLMCGGVPPVVPRLDSCRKCGAEPAAPFHEGKCENCWVDSTTQGGAPFMCVPMGVSDFGWLPPGAKGLIQRGWSVDRGRQLRMNKERE